MDSRGFAFLSCVGCSFFFPKRLFPDPEAASGSPLFVGCCTAEVEAVWVLWKSLEDAVARAGSCPDREPASFDRPHCGWFEATADSSASAYPYSCVHYRTTLCPFPAEADARA